MQIGVGVTTFNRPKHLTLWLQQYEKHKPKGAKLHIANDNVERKGIAYRKNECLKALKDCDYIFLFDDDTFPIADGWAEYFINTKQNHLLYLKETPTLKKINSVDGIDKYNNCGGAMIFLTKEVIEKVGGFHKGYGIYGYEHAGYSKRIHMAGLTPLGEYLSPSKAGSYIYAMDYDNYLPFNKELKHHPALAPGSILKATQNNLPHFAEDIKTIYQEL